MGEALALLVAVVVAVVAGVEVALGASKTAIEVPIGLGGAVALVVLAYARFEAFVLALLAIRTVVDYTKQGATSVTRHAPSSGHVATAVALLFLAAAALWLVARYRAGLPLPNSGVVVALALFVGTGALSVAGSARPVDSANELGRIVAAAAMFCVLEALLTDLSRVRMVLVACFTATAAPLMFAAYQAASGKGAFLAGGYSRVRGTFVQPNVLGFFLAMFLVMGAGLFRHLRPRVRVLMGVLLVGAGVGLLLTYSRGNWIAAIVGIVIVGVLQSRRLLVFLAIGGLAVLALVPSVVSRVTNLQKGKQVSGTAGNSLAWRFGYWRQSAALAEKNILTGIGLKMTDFSTQEAKPPHNDFLRAYVETGLLGLVAYVGLVFALGREAWRALLRAPPGFSRGVAVGFAGCFCSFLIESAGGNLMSQVVVLWYFFAFAASAFAVGRLGLQARAAGSVAGPVTVGT